VALLLIGQLSKALVFHRLAKWELLRQMVK